MANNYSAEYEKTSDALPGQSLDWLKVIRADAFKCFSDKGFPSLREEEWRYTNVAAIEKKLFTPQFNVEVNEIDKELLQNYQLDGVFTIVLVNGRVSLEHSNLEGLSDNISVLSMVDALDQKPELVEKYLAQAVNDKEHSFVAFNTAWFSDGLFIHVQANQVIEKPIQLLHIVTQADLLATTRSIVVVDEMAEASIIETYVGVENVYLTAAVTEVFVGKNAVLTLYKMQSEGDKAYHFGGIYVKQDKESRFTHHNFSFGGLLARNDIHTDLNVASECDLNGLFLGVKRQHIDNHTRINHAQPHAMSRELYKGVLNQRARGVFQGRVIVAEDAQQTNSEMNNRNLLLSNDAEVDTKPQLEIYADDVKCAHGVTVGQLDEKSVFYLQSRCLDEKTARNILTFAFANEMVDKIKVESLHEKLLLQLLQRFPQEGVEKSWL
ncbi:MAG: Fe-S cluster assembly protein SufD [Methylococcales bacterium]|nr:Fe-S cluster assembly protein SufD [Methylococcales bacterium]